MSNEETRPTDEDLQELERLRAENEALRAEVGQKKERHGLRRWTSVVLAVVSAVLVPLAALTVWTQRTALDTDQYVDTVGPLARNEAVQNRVTEVVSAEINASVDFEQLFNETIDEAGLPEQLSALAGPLAGGAESIVERVVGEVVSSEAFATLWEDANRAGHEVIVAVLTGEGSDRIETDSGTIRISFDNLVAQVSELLGGILGEDLVAQLGLEDVEAEVVLFESEDLAAAQELVDLLDALAWIVPLITLGLLALVVVVAHDRRRGFRRVGLAILLSSLISLALLAVLRNRVVGEAQDAEAARAVVDQLLTFLLQEFRVLVVLGVVILFGAWFAGPAKSAVRARAWGNTMLGRVSTVEDATQVGAIPVWVARRRTGLLAAALILGGLALLIADRPTGWTVLLIAIVTGAVMIGIEAVARVGRQAADIVEDAEPTGEVSTAAEPEPSAP